MRTLDSTKVHDYLFAGHRCLLNSNWNGDFGERGSGRFFGRTALKLPMGTKYNTYADLAYESKVENGLRKLTYLWLLFPGWPRCY